MQGSDKWNPKEDGEGKISGKELYIRPRDVHLDQIEAGVEGL